MLNAFRAEAHKWRRNWFPLVAAGAALSGPVLIFLTAVMSSGIPTAEMMMHNMLMFYLVLIGPLVVTLIGAQLIAAEYQWNSWKLLMTAPVPRWTIYAAKWLLGVIWILVLSVLVTAAGFLAARLAHATGTVDYWLWIKVFLSGGVGLCALLSGYQFITLVTRNFFATSAIGIVAAFASLLAAQSRYVGIFPITGNFLMAQLRAGRSLPADTTVIGTPAVWTAILAGAAVLGLVCSLVYVEKSDFAAS